MSWVWCWNGWRNSCVVGVFGLFLIVNMFCCWCVGLFWLMISNWFVMFWWCWLWVCCVVCCGVMLVVW